MPKPPRRCAKRGCREWQPCALHQGWLNSNTKPLPTNWGGVKRRARRAYGEECARCRRRDRPQELDHIVPRRWGGSDDLSNLQWLCKTPCHKDKTREDKKRYRRG